MTDNKMKDWFDHRKCKQIIPPGAQWKMGQKLTVYVIKINHHQLLEMEQLGVSAPPVVLSLPLCNASQPKWEENHMPNARCAPTRLHNSDSRVSISDHPPGHFSQGTGASWKTRQQHERFLTSSCTQELLELSCWFIMHFFSISISLAIRNIKSSNSFLSSLIPK